MSQFLQQGETCLHKFPCYLSGVFYSPYLWLSYYGTLIYQCRPNKITNISLYVTRFAAVFCKIHGSPFINDSACNSKKPWQIFIPILNVFETRAKICLHQRLMLQLESDLRCASVCMHALPNVEVLYIDILVGSCLPLAPKEKTLLCRGLCSEEKRRKKG